jgi:hypothetical protein
MYLHIVSPLLLLLLLLQEGVGRRIGEQSEHHWSRAKPWFLLARYMTFAHWWDGYNAVCALLSELMQQELPGLLE